MDTKLTPSQAALYERVDRVLWEAWDPIGVNDTPEAAGEYASYVPGVFAMALAGSDARVIAEHLHSLETLNMGFGGSCRRCSGCERAAAEICDARREIMGVDERTT